MYKSKNGHLTIYNKKDEWKIIIMYLMFLGEQI